MEADNPYSHTSVSASMTNWILALLWLYACGLMAALDSQTSGMPATITMYVVLTA